MLLIQWRCRQAAAPPPGGAPHHLGSCCWPPPPSRQALQVSTQQVGVCVWLWTDACQGMPARGTDIYMCTKLIERPALGVITTDERCRSIAAGKAARRRSSWPPRACHLDSFVAPLKQRRVFGRVHLCLCFGTFCFGWTSTWQYICTRRPSI